MFRGDDDEKLFVLEPVVVLERIERIHAVQSDCLEPVTAQRRKQPVRKTYHSFKPYGNDKEIITHATKKLDKVTEKIKIEDERPHMCTQCGDRFHTSILLAVHKRIHNVEEESDDDDDNAIENTDDTSLDNRCSDLSLTAASVSEETNSSQNILHNPHQDTDSSPVIAIPVPEKSIIVKNVQTCKNDHQNSSVSNKLNKLMHRDHDYSLSPDRNPALKSLFNRKATLKQDKSVDKKERKRHSGFVQMFTCKQCPVSFSRSWYLQLHMTLLHYSHQKNKSVECPGCNLSWEKEEHLRQHVENSHNSDLLIMNGEISTCLRVPTDALTGENKKYTKKRLFSQGCPVKPISTVSKRLACNWQTATAAEKDEILDLVEAELRLVVTERNKMGDHFTYGDIHRLGMEVAECLHVSNFLDRNPSKRWAQRILGSVGQLPRPGKYRFVHNANISYLNAVTNLSARGLSEHTIFYVFELNICDVKQNNIVVKPRLPSGASSPEGKNDSVSAILSTNASGTVLLNPTFTYRGQIVDYKNILKNGSPPDNTPPKDFLETTYVQQWFSQFLTAIPKARPVLLLMEGDVSKLPYSIILMARESDVHLVFLPSRKRFVHPHQLIRKSLASPLVESFAREIENFLSSYKYKYVNLNYFGLIFDLSWDFVVQNAEMSKSFLQSGFLPLPQSTLPLEEAARKYLNVVLFSKGQVSGNVLSSTETQSDDCTSAKLVESKTHAVGEDQSHSIDPLEDASIKLETVEDCIDSNSTLLPLNIKEEPEEDPMLPESDTPIDSVLDMKQEPMEYNVPTQVSIPVRMETLKCEYNCANCNQSFHSNGDLSKHTCTEDSDNSLSCPVCDEEFAEEHELLKHKCNSNLRSSVECDLHTCHICNMSFALQDTLNFHLTTHRSNSGPPLKEELNDHSAQQSSDVCCLEDFEHSECSKTEPSSSSVQSSVSCKRVLKLGDDVACKVPRLFELHESDPSSPQMSSALSTSSRTVSPSSSVSSRTLTASPCDVWLSDAEAHSVETDPGKGNPNLPKMDLPKFTMATPVVKSKLIPPPIPEHDYLGQVRKENKPKAFVPYQKAPREQVLSEEKGKESDALTIPYHSVSSLVSSSHIQSRVLSRKQTKKVMRRIQLVSAESKLVKRLSK